MLRSGLQLPLDFHRCIPLIHDRDDMTSRGEGKEGYVSARLVLEMKMQGEALLDLCPDGHTPFPFWRG